ncbi:MAG: site-specific DNA-methyltransferase [Treponema sp.]|nr:site-specific DNA-methyltransferase [Treponema sp.]
MDKTLKQKNNFLEFLLEFPEEFTPFYISDNEIIFNANCLEILHSIPENSIDMIFADPPYLLSNDGITCQNGKMVNVNKGEWDKSNGFKNDTAFHDEWISACRHILKPEGTIWISGTYHSIYQCGYFLQKNLFHILNDITWLKPNASPNLSCRFFTASHETLIWARKDKKAKHTFNYEEMKSGVFPEDKLKKENAQMRSVWSIGTPKNSEKEYGKHPTQKPLDLLKRIILASTNENDIVLDPFCGSGTTGVACRCLGNRSFIGMDIEKKYCTLTKKRLVQSNSRQKIS